MVMKVGNINNVFFRGKIDTTSNNSELQKKEQIRELSAVTPDFKVNTPISYKKLGETQLANGLTIHSYKLANGYKVSVIPMEGSPAVVKNYVNVGAMNETADIKGISHFLEHMAFNGTNGENGHEKLNVGDSFKKIDAMGGWANASTNYAITDYVNSTPQLGENDLEKQIKVIAAMAEDLELSDKMIAKEKNPVCSEINMILDDPQTIALDQTVRSLYNIKNPTDEMVGGSVQSIKNLTRDDVVNYYNKYYTPDNMNLVVTGDVNPDEVIKIASKTFNSKKVSKGRKFEENLTPINKTVRKDFISDKATSTEIILGFAGPKNNDVKERVAYDVAQAYLNSYSVGLKQNLKKFNTGAYFDSEKIGTNPNCARMTYVAVNSDEAKSEQVLKALFESISNAKNIDEKDLANLKQKILKNRNKAFEYSSVVNDNLGKAVLDNNMKYLTDYENILESLNTEDVNNALKKYFDLNKTAVTVVHPQKNNEVSFKGKARTPIKQENVEEIKLPNNFDVGFYKTKSNNFNYVISLVTDKPYNKKAGVLEVLNEIYTMGTAKTSEEDWNNIKEGNYLSVNATAATSGISVIADGSQKNRKLALEKAEEILYNPNITQENLDKAKDIIKDLCARSQDTANTLYCNDEAKSNPYSFTKDEVLNALDTITLDDVKDCHNYILNNSRGVIVANLPANSENECKQDILNAGMGLASVKPNKQVVPDTYNENKVPKVLTKANNNSQADIMQVYKFKSDNSIRETVLGKLTNSILSSSSIGLFDVLREKEHLAYSVHSDISKVDNQGEIACSILTTTDNKDIGEFSYDNVQKSIEGFTRQINELKSGKFTDEDLANAKLALKAQLLNNEGTYDKLAFLDVGLESKYGITYHNQFFDEIDKITKDDILKFAGYAFKNPPTYSIVASQDTLDNNKEFLEHLK